MKSSPIRWDSVDTVLLDMDGTVLDLHFDNEFWSRHLPQRYAEFHGVTRDEADRRLAPVFADNAGHLNWYCTDYWSRVTGLDVMALKAELAGLIGPLPGARGFLDRVRASGRPIWLVTNAHPASVRLKLERTGLRPRFERVISSHDFGHAKEAAGFWAGLRARHDFDPARALFVDDSPAVVAAAAAWGIGQVVALSHPDSRGCERRHDHAVVARRLAELTPP